MNHGRTVRTIVGTNVLQIKSLFARQVVIELNRSELPFAANAITDDEVGFGAIKGCFARFDLRLDPQDSQTSIRAS